MNLKEKVRKNILNLKPYSSARSEFKGSGKIFLDANENPFDNGLNRYPDPMQTELKNILSKQKDISDKNIAIGNGSDELIDLLFRIFCEPGRDNIVVTSPTYGMYKVSADINDIEIRESNLGTQFELNQLDLLSKTDNNTKLIFLCSPNNPSGNILKPDAIIEVLQNFDGVVVIDEAYIDFSDERSWIREIENYPQIVVLQTFSKSAGLAGIRLGVAYADAFVIDLINKVKPPYNVNALSQQKALNYLAENKDLNEFFELIRTEKNKLVAELEKLDNVIRVFPSDANFLLVKFKNADETYDQLCQQGVVVRNRNNVQGCENCLRISVGKPEENDQLIESLKIIENEKSIIY